jgi:hypothetical protein
MNQSVTSGFGEGSIELRRLAIDDALWFAFHMDSGEPDRDVTDRDGDDTTALREE